MKIKALRNAFQGISAVAILALAQLATAADWNISGFIRQEGAYKLGSGDENYWNQHGNLYNNVPTVNAVNAILGIQPAEITRPNYTEDNDWNHMMTRFELDIEGKFNDNLKLYIKTRVLYDWDVYDSFGEPNYFEVPFRGDCATRLEICGEDYMVDMPAFYLDYSKGRLWLRVGNQQIAWGESLFFRVLDVPNGLDLRRHGILDFASEEYSDKRVSGLGARGSYRFRNDWELEAFVQEFQATVYGNENTPYNIIGRQFVVQQEDTFDDVDGTFSFGARLRGQIGELGLQFMAVSRRNPDGVFRWTTSKVNPFVAAGIGDSDPVLAPGLTVGGMLSQTPFQPFTGQGVFTALEWFDYAGRTRLNGANLQQLLDDFPAAAALAQPIIDGFGLGTIDNYDAATILLDAFFSVPAGGLGDLRGHIERSYPREVIFGFGMNYMFFGEPDSLIDQLVVRFEATFTPDKKFTDIALAQKYREDDEWVTSLVFEKYHRFSQNFPATFLVLQWMHKSESDMFGRSLDGFGADQNNSPPKGRDGFDAFTFALQQAFPNLIWRADLAILWDPKGGYLIQPALRWKPSGHLTAEAFFNFVDGEDDNTDMMGTLGWSDEFTLRLTYQF